MKFKGFIILIIILLPGMVLAKFSLRFALWYFAIYLSLEIGSYLLVHHLRKGFQWLITSRDEYPKLDPKGLKKFIEHGYDPELGWIRKPNTSKEELGKKGKTQYHINDFGSRYNPGNEGNPEAIACYGDSFAFARQVNDNETFEHYLSEMTNTNVLNFAVGNYGLDQVLLRLKREYPKHKTRIVIIGVVPSTIVRIISVWKHYSEFGNTFGFKPRYILSEERLKLINNFIDNEEKFLRYQDFLPEIKRYDECYESKFKEDMIRSPYFISLLSKPLRHFPLIALIIWDRWFIKNRKVQPYPLPVGLIMKHNLKQRVDLFFKNKKAVELLERLMLEFVAYSRENDFTPIFMWMPQKDDILFVKKKGNYYKEFIDYIRNKLCIIDLTEVLVQQDNLGELYCDDSHYGGHLSSKGNKLVAQLIYKVLEENNFLEKLGGVKKQVAAN